MIEAGTAFWDGNHGMDYCGEFFLWRSIRSHRLRANDSQISF